MKAISVVVVRPLIVIVCYRLHGGRVLRSFAAEVELGSDIVTAGVEIRARCRPWEVLLKLALRGLEFGRWRTYPVAVGSASRHGGWKQWELPTSKLLSQCAEGAWRK